MEYAVVNKVAEVSARKPLSIIQILQSPPVIMICVIGGLIILYMFIKKMSGISLKIGDKIELSSKASEINNNNDGNIMTDDISSNQILFAIKGKLDLSKVDKTKMPSLVADMAKVIKKYEIETKTQSSE